ncbi:PREDICTED: telomere-associated protein RIF1-like [Priapulus caudatus]|uniref:Telomere-associated protein RIF1-like n=1 Tax=Priapulus caudatus TaxID=37621 RepID=A0ABM1E8C5_PRICU|nr:PREDICTED: telomere-associated protein RIF1-like [Priapulus caudatus]
MLAMAAPQPGHGADWREVLCADDNVTRSTEEKIFAYTLLIEELKTHNVSSVNDINKVVPSLLRDIREGLAFSVQALGLIWQGPSVLPGKPDLGASEGAGEQLLRAVCAMLHAPSIDKTVAVRGLWCVSRQALPTHVIETHFDEVMSAVEATALGYGSQSASVEYETLNVIIRLLEQAPGGAETHWERWLRLVLPHIVHPAPKVRERAQNALCIGLPLLMKHQDEVADIIVPDLKNRICPEMMSIFNNASSNGAELAMLKTWRLLVEILGRKIHHGSSVVNSMLRLVESGFKHKAPAVRTSSFRAWARLIDNFGLDLNILANHKRLKLLLQPFLIASVKHEAIAHAKFDTWWHLVVALRNRLSAHFEEVCVPLLQFCVMGGYLKPALMSPQAPNTSATVLPLMSTPKRTGGAGAGQALPMLVAAFPESPQRNTVYRFLQTYALQVLASLVAPSSAHPLKDGISIERSLCGAMINSSMVFVKHAATLLATFVQCCRLLANEEEPLLLRTWRYLIGQVNGVISQDNKSDIADVMSSLLNVTGVIISEQLVSPATGLKLLDELTTISDKVLSSHSFHGGSGDVMHGSPALHLLQLLFCPSLVAQCGVDERFTGIFSALCEGSMRLTSSPLMFAQSVMDHLRGMQGAPPDAVMRLWSIIARPLYAYVDKSNEVNQGDALEHDFTCMYAVLLFPVSHLNDHQPPTAARATLKTWSDLYTTLVRCAALVATTTPNQCCEDLCVSIAGMATPQKLQNVNWADIVANLLQVMVGCVSFGTFSSATGGAGVSPVKWGKRRQRPLGNLTHLVDLITRLLDAVVAMETELDGEERAASSSVLASFVAMVTTIVEHIGNPPAVAALLEKLAPPLGRILKQSSEKREPTLYTAAVKDKIDRLWSELGRRVEGGHSGACDSSLLLSLAPALEPALLHPRRKLRNQAAALSNATFGKAGRLEYPDTLRECLLKVREQHKTFLLLPGIASSETSVIEDTPSISQSERSQMEPEVHMPGSPSPHKKHGSFLQRHLGDNTPERFVRGSPARTNASPATRVRRSLRVDDDRDEKFVFIAPSPKKKFVLTEHQREKLRDHDR